MKRIWNYFKDSWEGSDGKASSKKLSLLAITINMIVYSWHVESMPHVYVFLTFAGQFMLLIGIMTWSNVKTLLNFTLPKWMRKTQVQEVDE